MTKPSRSGLAARSRMAGAVPGLLGVLVLLGVLYVLEPGVDFYYTYNPTIRSWLFEGLPLYGREPYGFFNPPWAAVFLLPFVLPPEPWGRVALAFFTFGVTFVATAYFVGKGRLRLPALALVLLSFHTLYVALAGQIDAFPLLGMVGGAWALDRMGGRALAPWVLSLSLVMLSIKPQVVLPAAAVLLLSLRQLPWRERLAVLSLPLVIFAASFPLFGMDWPWQWWQAYRDHPPFAPTIVTTWRAAQELGLPQWVPAVAVVGALLGAVLVYRRVGPTLDMVSLALATGAVTAGYSSPSSSILILAVCYPRLLAVRPHLAVPLYVVSLTPLLRLSYSFAVAWTDVAFWWALWLATFATATHQSRKAAVLDTHNSA